ncbi:hypothetical protein ACGFYV_21660 [Streptomyces sp. NPDC048297]|uniref:hypothetical protein n=1 Tax=Streptomyces sp. NPDC048297 TaxID=3365531 RepID=UPI0037104693
MPPPPQQPYPHVPQQQPSPYGQQPPSPYGQRQPGPYGQRQPGPYGQQAPGPYGSPYPQQQPHPQQPHPQQPYPAWGMPPMGPPPKKRRLGLVLGIVGGVVTLGVVALVLLGALVESGFPPAKNRLTLPHKLLNGTYVLAEDLSGSEGQKVEDEADGAWDAKDIHAVVGRYSPGGDDSTGMLLVSGMYGRFMNKDDVRAGMLKGATEADGVTVTRPAKDVTPPGADTAISCEVLTQKRGLTTLTYPVCSWADGNTAAVVGELTLKQGDSATVDLDTAARHTLEIRSEMLEPVS